MNALAALLALTAAAAEEPAAAPTPAAPLELSSMTISDPHQLVRGALHAPETVKLPAFPESLIYDVAWGLLSVGQATLQVEDVVDFNGRPAYHIVSRAISNRFCDTFYKVRDLNESWLNLEATGGFGYSKKLREGSFFRDEWVLYDKGRWLAKTVNRDGSSTYAEGASPEPVHDILSSLYFTRTRPMTEGAEFILDVNTKENWPLVVRVLKREKVKTPAGTFDAWLVEPALRREGLFIQKGKRLQLWLTDDARKMPVQMKVEVFFGHITAKLSKIL